MQENIRGRGSARHGRASVEHIVHTTHDAGIDASLPEAVLEIFKRGWPMAVAGTALPA